MKYFIYLFLFFSGFGLAQHRITLEATFDPEKKGFEIIQEIEYQNQSNDTLNEIVLNDWNNAYSSKSSPLARRFSDEFYRAFHLAKESDRGYTEIKELLVNNRKNNWSRFNKQVDVIILPLSKPLLPNSSVTIHLKYFLKVPNARFTDFGFTDSDKFNLKYWYITPALYQKNGFLKISNENLDDISIQNHYLNAILKNCNSYFINSNLTVSEIENSNSTKISGFVTKDVVLVLNKEKERNQFKNEIVTVENSIESKLDDVNKALIVDNITRFVNEYLPINDIKKIVVTNEDYKRQPFYGLNQLPSFFSPFTDNFIYELKFLKTYTNNYLDEVLHLNARDEYWLHDGIQVYLMMEYIKTYHPDVKMSGRLADFKLLKSYHFINLDFNQQYNYLYLLMARKNLDQSLLEPKNQLIKFNEQIAGKYKAGLSINYLQEYLGENIIKNAIQELVSQNYKKQVTTETFRKIIESKTDKDLDWFFDDFLNTRQTIDYTFGRLKKTDLKTQVKIINRSNVTLPIPLYYIKNDTIVKKEWLTNIKNDTVISFDKNYADKLILNYENEVPEFNLRNNYKSLKGFLSNNKPIKFVLYEDLENPKYSQLFYVPEFNFNLYDGLATGIKFDNKSLLNKPFTFTVTPSYSPKTGTLVGKFGTSFEHNIREPGKLYKIRYNINGSKFHYAEDAAYTTFNPSIQVFFRDPNFRVNKNEYIFVRQQFITREPSPFVTSGSNSGSYNVFQAYYGNIQSEATKLFSYSNGVQISNSFSKLTAEINYRRLFENNQRISLRLFAGTFMYKDTKSTFFDFGIDRPTDYSFDTNLLGRSESSGLASQQFINSEAAFKSKLDVRFANQWIIAVNASTNVWNWIQIYGDAGLVKNNYTPTRFIFDSGVHLNLVPDYFELFLPVYSSNGFELNEKNYGERIRFIITLSPKTLLSLFTRKWF